MTLTNWNVNCSWAGLHLSAHEQTGGNSMDIAERITEEYNLSDDEQWLELMEAWPNYTSTQKSTLVVITWTAMQKKDKSFWLMLAALAIGGLTLGLADSPLAFAMGMIVMLLVLVVIGLK